ncbi:uncharacterized protein NDAI_0G01460 [Naumovozyma dairenensis CBS 421]|uniref:Uncharacterized protein n=1 Tax=Naumovozyma dairenensis (strain ATCC 10597 / BCRC 20456 / CBS 421 / NBRC 0211 / NRRL Y-12639) TaxID=1071378 RepID=G0WDR1_NAUDC|nr:hypothetical protein NDAI_0G01460 [Naumovozyma dairenensis CBS 421]CCD25922.2 hypothetical protein NDAI_0G01460 [Naumovozyma dairenensis CBS 421]
MGRAQRWLEEVEEKTIWMLLILIFKIIIDHHIFSSKITNGEKLSAENANSWNASSNYTYYISLAKLCDGVCIFLLVVGRHHYFLNFLFMLALSFVLSGIVAASESATIKLILANLIDLLSTSTKPSNGFGNSMIALTSTITKTVTATPFPEC